MCIRDSILTNGKVHHLPVIDEGKLVGLLTTHDINRLSRSNIDFERTPIEDIMTTQLATLDPNAKVGTASEILLENLFHAIPIVDAESHLVGLVTSFDLLKYSYNKAYPDSWWLQKGSQRMAASHVSAGKQRAR